MRSKHGGYYITGHLRQVTSLPNEANTIVLKVNSLNPEKKHPALPCRPWEGPAGN